jgi:hypothetical protein
VIYVEGADFAINLVGYEMGNLVIDKRVRPPDGHPWDPEEVYTLRIEAIDRTTARPALLTLFLEPAALAKVVACACRAIAKGSPEIWAASLDHFEKFGIEIHNPDVSADGDEGDDGD